MTKRWKLKTNSANTLLVLITLILVEAEATRGDADAPEGDRVRVFVGHDEIAGYFFGRSADDASLVLEGVNRCLDNFQLVTCIKMLLLERINDVGAFLQEPGVAGRDLHFLRGAVVFRVKNETEASGLADGGEASGLDEEIAAKVSALFRGRSLLVSLLPGVQIEVEPSRKRDGGDIVCFSYRVHTERESGEQLQEGRKRKGGGMSMMMLVPQMIMLGLMPFTLASLKAMVMNAVMINMMALNGAIFMTIRNLVFGPRSGDNVKYVNYGYSKDRQTQSKKPVLVIHSPAAFVRQPPVHRHPVEVHLADAHSALFQDGGHPQEYYLVQEDGHGTQRRRQGNPGQRVDHGPPRRGPAHSRGPSGGPGRPQPRPDFRASPQWDSVPAHRRPE